MLIVVKLILKIEACTIPASIQNHLDTHLLTQDLIYIFLNCFFKKILFS